jgi:hypothetical protein
VRAHPESRDEIMKTLQVEASYIVLKLTDRKSAPQTLTEQALPFFALSPVLVLDVDGIQFSSMLIGEILNVHRGFADQWEGNPYRVALVNVTDTSRQVLQRVRLDTMFPMFATVDEALHGAQEPPASRTGTA